MLTEHPEQFDPGTGEVPSRETIAASYLSGHMGYRRFVDRAGRVWEVKDRSRSEWIFEPAAGNPEPSRTVQAPSYEADPFELSNEELQRLLDRSPSAGGAGKRRSPFRDD